MSAKAKPKPKVAKRASHTREYKIEAIRLRARLIFTLVMAQYS
jgi:hypothetical protein